MNFKEQIYSALIVSASEKFNASFAPFFPDFKYKPVFFEKSISAAKRAIAEREFDFIIINLPLSDDDGVRFSIDVCSNGNSVVLLLVRNEAYSAVFSRVMRHGVFVLPKPTSKQTVMQALDWMATAAERFKTLKKHNLSIEEKMQEIRLVNRAKWLLITENKMTESEAHRYIEKQAMNKGEFKKTIAEEIIKNYS